MKRTLFFLLAASMTMASCRTFIESPGRVIGLIESPEKLGECRVLVAYPAKSKKRKVREAWVDEPIKCSECHVADSIFYKTEIQIVKAIQ